MDVERERVENVERKRGGRGEEYERVPKVGGGDKRGIQQVRGKGGDGRMPE